MTDTPAGPPFLQATVADAEGFDFEAPITGVNSASYVEICGVYRRLLEVMTSDGEDASNSSAFRITAFMEAVLSMHLRPQMRHEPFGPMFVLPDQSRSAAPEDFREQVELLAELATKAKHYAVKARLADVCWLLQRKRADMAAFAIDAYVAILTGIENGSIKTAPWADSLGILSPASTDLLRRAMAIVHATGRNGPAAAAVMDTIQRLRGQAIGKSRGATVWFSELDLEFSISGLPEVADGIEAVLASEIPGDTHTNVRLWNLAGAARRKSGDPAGADRCQVQAAEALVREAEGMLSGSMGAMLAASSMAEAIAQLHGVAGAKERRKELRHRLIDIQAAIPDEMTTQAFKLDTQPLVTAVNEMIGGKGLLERLFIFLMCAESPDPDELTAQAVEMVKAMPFYSRVTTNYLDSEGKTLHRIGGGGRDGTAEDPAVIKQTAMLESIRRSQASVTIETARQAIVADAYLAEDSLIAILRHSPFVPTDLAWTYSRGFLRFFQGDMTSAAYTLMPLLEGSLRHVLKSHDHDVTKFDDATMTQEERTISSMFDQMRPELDAIFGKANTADIARVFLNHPGPRLRHNLAHGLSQDGTPFGSDALYAMWLMFRLCLTPLFRHFDTLQAALAGSCGFA